VSTYDGVADRYDATRGGDARGTEFAAMIDARLPPGVDQILDIGVGTGTVASGLQALGRQVIGVDLSMGMLSWALRRLGRRVAMADGCALPIGSASISCALSVWVVHHVQEPQILFAEVHRVLRPGGRYLACPNFRSAPDDPIDPIMLAMYRRAGNIRQWRQPRPMDAATILQLAGEAGFAGEIEEVENQPRLTTREEQMASISGRAYPPLVDLTDREFESVAGPALGALSRLPEGPIVRPAFTEIVMLDKPVM
jgi:ubiquinone/menaquinone biosynthesis C-methylase UbiE